MTPLDRLRNCAFCGEPFVDNGAGGCATCGASADVKPRALCGTCDTTMAVAGVPNHLRARLCRWKHAGVRTGDFLRAVLENDLRGAVRRADDDSAAALANIVRWLYLEAPGNCWGSPVLVAAWALAHEERRAAAAADADAAALNATTGGAP